MKKALILVLQTNSTVQGNLLYCWSMQHCFIMAHYRCYIVNDWILLLVNTELLYYGTLQVLYNE